MASSQKNVRVRAVNTANTPTPPPIRLTGSRVAALHVAEIAHGAADADAPMDRASPIEPVQKDPTADPSGGAVVTTPAASARPEDAPGSMADHEAPVRIVAIAAPFVMQPAPARPDLLPCELAGRIRRGVEAAVDGRYGADPIFSAAASRVSSVQDSLQRRDGLYAEAAVIAGLDMSPRVRVLRDPRVRSIAVSRAADEIATRSSFATCQMIDLPADAPTGATLTTDVVAIDSRLGEAIGLESKRGAKIGSDDRATLVQSAERGAYPEVMCATKDGLAQRALYGPTGRMETGGPVGRGTLQPHAYDKRVMVKLWEHSEEATGFGWELDGSSLSDRDSEASAA